MSRNSFTTIGFTLIELSLVLVIIGLLVGSVLVGRDLIRASEIRAQISQVEHLNTATNTFRSKFNALPGDISAAQVTQFGFTSIPSRNATVAEGDGNGLVEGICCSSIGIRGNLISGETAWFWVDIANNSGLFPGNFVATATPSSGCSGPAKVASMLPAAKIGSGNYLAIIAYNNNTNWLTLSNISFIDNCGTINSGAPSYMPLTILQASAIDNKMDDGLPQTGIVQAFYSNQAIAATGKTWASGGNVGGTSDTSATAASATSCFDNANIGGANQKYSLTQNGGLGVNCALSFKFP